MRAGFGFGAASGGLVNTPYFDRLADGPVRQPADVGGFEYFYGFIGGETNQWEPAQYMNTTAIGPYDRPDVNYRIAMARR